MKISVEDIIKVFESIKQLQDENKQLQFDLDKFRASRNKWATKATELHKRIESLASLLNNIPASKKCPKCQTIIKIV